jgi:hypothetical protein
LIADGVLRARAVRLPGRILVAVLLVCSWPSPAGADWLVVPFVGALFAGDTNIALLEEAAGGRKLAFGGALSLLGDGVLGAEMDVSYAPRFFQREEVGLVRNSTVFTMMGNGVIAAPRRWIGYSLRPFASGGMGWMHVSQDDSGNVFPVNSNLLGFNVGGGVLGFFDDRRGLRLDLRYFRFRSDDEEDIAFGETVNLRYWRMSAGFVLKY